MFLRRKQESLMGGLRCSVSQLLKSCWLGSRNRGCTLTLSGRICKRSRPFILNCLLNVCFSAPLLLLLLLLLLVCGGSHVLLTGVACDVRASTSGSSFFLLGERK